MNKNTFKYFAYGSNMLTERLNAPTRCTSAVPIGIAYVTNYKISFTKESEDKTGKATLIDTCDESDIVYGVLFEINNTEDEIKKLDIAEGVSNGGYKVEKDFTVIFNNKTINNVRTYIAPDEKCKEGLLVYDWYLALVIAGARQHKLDKIYISKMIKENEIVKDLKNNRESKTEAFRILKEIGSENILSELNY